MTNPMTDIYKRLEHAGLERRWVKKTALPDWWEDAIARNPAGYAEALAILADHLSLNLSELFDPNSELHCAPALPVRNKARQGTRDEDLLWAQSVCGRVVQIACAAMVVPPSPLPDTAAEVRRFIGKDYHPVHLSALLDYCWSVGIPVLHAQHLPQRGRKPDGMAVRVGDRYAIVLSKNSCYSAWQLFILAHELGHIVHGHLRENGFIVDDDNWSPDHEQEERQADDFAVELLTGATDTAYESHTPLTARELAGAARYTSVKQRVDAGVVVLNYARRTENWGAGVAALKILEPDANAISAIQAKGRKRLNLDLLSDESRDFLFRVTGIEGVEP